MNSDLPLGLVPEVSDQDSMDRACERAIDTILREFNSGDLPARALFEECSLIGVEAYGLLLRDWTKFREGRESTGDVSLGYFLWEGLYPTYCADPETLLARLYTVTSILKTQTYAKGPLLPEIDDCAQKIDVALGWERKGELPASEKLGLVDSSQDLLLPDVDDSLDLETPLRVNSALPLVYLKFALDLERTYKLNERDVSVSGLLWCNLNETFGVVGGVALFMDSPSSISHDLEAFWDSMSFGGSESPWDVFLLDYLPRRCSYEPLLLTRKLLELDAALSRVSATASLLPKDSSLISSSFVPPLEAFAVAAPSRVSPAPDVEEDLEASKTTDRFDWVLISFEMPTECFPASGDSDEEAGVEDLVSEASSPNSSPLPDSVAHRSPQASEDRVSA